MTQVFQRLVILAIMLFWAVGGHTAHAQSAAMGSWQQITPASGDAPAARYDHILVAAEGKLVLFGGRAGGALADTWIYDVAENTWREIKTETAPKARWGMAAAYDAARKRVLLFAGQAQGFFNDVWAFDLAGETWSEIEVSGTPPVARYGTSAVVDPRADALLISHGFASGRYDDTFALDLKTNTWQDVSPAERPLKRCLHEAAFDEGTGRMILFGGCSSGHGPCPQGDTWAYDPATRAWTELKSSSAAPTPRSNPALVADGSGALWLFGGRTSSGYDAELWTLDPASGAWTQHAFENGPSGRSSHDAAWDASSGQLVVFGGRDASGPLSDLWAFKP